VSRRIRLTGLLSLLALVACAALACGASAVVLELPEGRLGYQPPRGQATPHSKQKSAASKTLTYHQGPVMTSNTNYPLFWAPAGEAAYPAGYISGIDRWFTDLAHDSGGLLNTDSVLNQYGDKEGGFADYDSHFGGAQIDTDPYPPSGCKRAAICLTKEQLKSEIQSYVEAHALPADLAHEYFVLTPPGVSTCFEPEGHQCSQETGEKFFKYCAYHSFFHVGGATYIWADNPYIDSPLCVAESPNESPSDYAISGGLAHEHSESVTDPEITGWYNEKEEEVADKCQSPNPEKELGARLGTAPDGAPYNQLINGDEYLYQQMWSNERAACVQRAALPPSVKKVTPRKGPSTGGTHVTVTGSGFLGTVTVYFGASQATEVKVTSGEALTAVSPPGTEEQAITVHTSAGASPPSKKTSFKYKPPKKSK